MFTPLLFVAIVNARQGAVVNLEIKGVRMVNAAPMLAKALGLDSLSIGPTIKDEVILFRAKDASVTDVKARFATALNATWEQKSDGWWLTQTSEQKIADQRTYQKDRYKYFAEMTEKAQKKIQELKPLDEAECKELQKQLKAMSSGTISRSNNLYRRYGNIDSQGPMSRFGYRAVLRLKPETWMKLTENSPRAVFSTNPTNMQQPFPFKVDDLLAQLMEDQNNWVNYAGTQELPGPSVEGNPNSRYYIGSLNQQRKPMKPTDFGVITMTLQLGGQGITFCAYDSKGISTLNTNVSFFDYGENLSEDTVKAELTRMAKKAVNLTGEAGEYLDLYAPKDPFRSAPVSIKPVSPSLLAKIVQPEKIDPLSFAAGDVFFASVDTPNVLMVMTDDFRTTRFLDFNSPLLQRQDMFDFTQKEGWSLLKFKDPIAIRKRMPDRQKLGKLLRFLNDNRRPLSLEEKAVFALELPWDIESEYLYQSHLRPLQSSVVESYSNRTGMRIYGSLNSSIRDRAKKGPIPLSTLSEETKLEIYRSLFYAQEYEAQAQMDWNYTSGTSQAQQTKLQLLQSMLYSGIYREKTFLLPNGLTNNLSLTIDDQTTNLLYASRPEPQGNQDYYGRGRTISPHELGQHLFRKTNLAKYPYEGQSYSAVDENKIQLASTRNITIKLRLDDGVYIGWQLGQTQTTDPQMYTTKTLPQEILTQIQKGYDEAEKNDKYYNTSRQTQTQNNPPPR